MDPGRWTNIGGVLAYLFWHRPRVGVEPADYEGRLRDFLERLDVPAASFRLEALPFGSGGGYEDWYLVEDWTALGVLNRAAVSGRPGPAHDAVAELAEAGWGGVYALLRGPAEPPSAARWADHPDDAARAVWRRQLVLGPAPEYCLAETGSPGRSQV
jgi:hypothetical protein